MDWRGVKGLEWGLEILYYLLNNEIFRCFLHYKVLKCSDAPMCERSFNLLETKDSYTNRETPLRDALSVVRLVIENPRHIVIESLYLLLVQ